MVIYFKDKIIYKSDIDNYNICIQNSFYIVIKWQIPSPWDNMLNYNDQVLKYCDQVRSSAKIVWSCDGLVSSNLKFVIFLWFFT